MGYLPRLLLLLHIALASGGAQADLVVVTSQKSGIEYLSRQEVVNLYMGRLRTNTAGNTATPLDLAVDTPERVEFYRLLVNKEPADIKAYWSRLVFSGGARPPQSAENIDELIRTISQTPGLVGYLPRKQLDNRLKVIYEFSVSP